MKSLQQQTGAVLIITLVFLLILTVVVMSSSSSSIMQEKMTLAVKDSSIALERAEEALREAEEYIANTDTTDIESSAHYFEPNNAPDPFLPGTWVSEDNPPASAVNGNAAYFIEKVGAFFSGGGGASDTPVQIGDVTQELASGAGTSYRVVARGTVTSGNQVQAQRILVIYFAK